MIARLIARNTLVLAFLAATLAGTTAQAGTFPNTRTMVITYAWGTCSMAQFDMVEAQYPGYLPTADLTFYNTSTFDAYDNASGSSGGGLYNVQGTSIVITILPSGPWGLVQYVGDEVAPGIWEGEIHVNGTVWGHWRGYM